MSIPGTGWYPDPHRPGGWRWWDGIEWGRRDSEPAPITQRWAVWLALAAAVVFVVGLALASVTSSPSVDPDFSACVEELKTAGVSEAPASVGHCARLTPAEVRDAMILARRP